MTYQAITLVSGATTITLPADMLWTDRRSFDPVAQNIERSASGAQIIEEFQMVGGYPITLVARGRGDTWVRRPQVDALRTLAATPLASPMTLTYNDGTVMSCRFRYSGSTPAVDAKPVKEIFPEDDSSGYSLTLNLMQASA
jgi:hypothetical protein